MIALMLAAAAASQPMFLKPPIGPDDYPQSALRNNEQGFEFVSVLVSPTGAVEKCDIIVPSKFRDLDDAACAHIMKAKVAPAKDTDGSPIYGVIRKWNTWSIGGPAKPPTTVDVTLTVNRLPPDLPPNPISKLTLVVDAVGKVERCEVATSSGNPSLDVVACTAGIAAAKVDTVKDASGAAVRAAVPFDVAFSTSAPEAKQN